MKKRARHQWAWLGLALTVCACAPLLPDDLPSLMEAMGSTDMRVHIAASKKVEKLYGEPGLLTALGHSNAGTRARAAMWLQDFRTPEARVALGAASGDRDDHVRMWVAYSLGEIGTSAEVGALERLAGDPAEIVRLKAAEAVGKVNAREGAQKRE